MNRIFKKTAIVIIFISCLQCCCYDSVRYFRIDGIYSARHSIDGYYGRDDSLIVDTGKKYFIMPAFNFTGLAINSIFHGFSMSAYASQKCDEFSRSIPLDTIMSINIISDAAFDDDHPPGRSLNNVFRHLQYDDPYGKDSGEALNMGSIVLSRPYAFELILKLIKRPSRSAVHHFSVSVGLTNGKSFTAITPMVTFKR